MTPSIPQRRYGLMQLNDPFDEGQMNTDHVPTTTTEKGKPMSTLKYQDVTMADFESQDAMMTPFLLSFEELREAINRSERDGVCSGKAAEAAREEIEELKWKLDLLMFKKIAFHQQFRTAEKVSK
jgi:hypothetical protein